MRRVSLLLAFISTVFVTHLNCQSPGKEKEMFQPVSYEQAEAKADSVLALMTLEEKIKIVGGDGSFFIQAIPRLNIHEVYMSDATQGVRLREDFRGIDLSKYQLEKTTAFPCPISLAAAWDPALAHEYARSIGEECAAGNIYILLGPGQNQYRISQCGRNFEYFGEDPFLRARIIGEYVKGLQSTGTVATLKHFVANNTEYFRRKSNSIIDDRTLNEIYFPSFKAGIDAGAKAVMTSYNQLNGEWCGQSATVIDGYLRNELGFRWLVMTDWSSVYDGEKVAKSGQDLEMPGADALKNLDELIKTGKVGVEDVDRMAKSILRLYFAMKFGEREKGSASDAEYARHELVALQTAREGIVLLKNDNDILPLRPEIKNILLTGDYVEKLAMGGGSATVKGYNHKLMLDELKKELGGRIHYIKNPSASQIKSADVVLCNIGTFDTEGLDRPFELPEDQEEKVEACVNNNPNTVVIVTSGSGVKMTDWNAKARAVVYAWYGGQNGNTALAEILSGKTNPSGKLPITIEKDFKDSPGYGYIPKGEKLYSDWRHGDDRKHGVYDIQYKEGIFVGYRWYEEKNIEPLYPFGHGLSYTSFDYSGLTVSKDKFNQSDTIAVSCTVKNVGKRKGMETVELYVQDVECSVPRPIKELKGFQKVELDPGESKTVVLTLDKKAFSFWNPATKNWFAEKGKFIIHVGSSSKDIRLKKEIELMD
jgi:beta-glucosidase